MRSFEHTYGTFSSESESCEALDEIIMKINGFVVHKEITGEIMHPRHGTKDRGVRIDRILLPKNQMARHGWDYGCIGIECKKSDKKVGRPLSQILDYTRAIWRITDTGIYTYCRYIFLWPMTKASGPVASIMAQNNIGSASIQGNGRWRRLSLQIGESNLLQYYIETDELKVNDNVLTGSKVGSR